MPKNFIYAIAILCSVMICGCADVSPQKSFGIAVLNSNMMSGFADDGLARELAAPSIKMGKTKDEMLPMQRSEVVRSKVLFLEENLEKLRGLPRTDDTKDIINASLALHELILPVLKNEYKALAALYDRGAPEKETEQLDLSIRKQYRGSFEKLYNKLIECGKLYAAKHGIQVKWNS